MFRCCLLVALLLITIWPAGEEVEEHYYSTHLHAQNQESAVHEKQRSCLARQYQEQQFHQALLLCNLYQFEWVSFTMIKMAVLKNHEYKLSLYLCIEPILCLTQISRKHQINVQNWQASLRSLLGKNRYGIDDENGSCLHRMIHI